MIDIQVSIDEEQLRRVNAVLYATPGKARTVLHNSIKRGLEAGRTKADREARERYDISKENIDAAKRVKTRISEAGDAVIGELEFSGKKIPLYKFNPDPVDREYTERYVNGYGGWRVTGPVSAADVKGRMQAGPQGFIATFASGHTGIFKRSSGTTSSGKEKIEEYWGFSIKDMLDYEPAREAIMERIDEITSKRIEQELYRILNGFGGRSAI